MDTQAACGESQVLTFVVIQAATFIGELNGLSHPVPDTQRVNDFVDACTHLLFRDVSVSRRLGLFNQTLDPIRFFRKETAGLQRSEEHTSELQSLMRISYAVFC